MSSSSQVAPPTAKPVAVSSDDPTLTLSNQRVKEAREAVKNGTDKVYRIYTDGIFDIFHLGHMNVLKQAKHALGDPSRVHLIAGICSDADTNRFKGPPVMDEQTRAQSVAQCKWVDSVICPAPWIVDDKFLEANGIDFLAHDAAPYASADGTDCYALVKSKGMFLATERTDGISTSDIIVQIVRDYDKYIDRNLSRGFDRSSLNVGRTWEIRAVAHEKGRKVDASLSAVSAAKSELAQTWHAFLDEFHRVKVKDLVTGQVKRVVRGVRRRAGNGGRGHSNAAGAGSASDAESNASASVGVCTDNEGEWSDSASSITDTEHNNSSNNNNTQSKNSSNCGIVSACDATTATANAKPESESEADADADAESKSAADAATSSNALPKTSSDDNIGIRARNAPNTSQSQSAISNSNSNNNNNSISNRTPAGTGAKPAVTFTDVTDYAASAAGANDGDSDEDSARYSTTLGKQLADVAKHSGRLCWAVTIFLVSLLSYLNILSYISKCRQTKRF